MKRKANSNSKLADRSYVKAGAVFHASVREWANKARYQFQTENATKLMSHKFRMEDNP